MKLLATLHCKSFSPLSLEETSVTLNVEQVHFLSECFSPLSLEETSVTVEDLTMCSRSSRFQSSIARGNVCDVHEMRLKREELGFSPLSLEETSVTIAMIHTPFMRVRVSVLYRSRKRL